MLSLPYPPLPLLFHLHYVLFLQPPVSVHPYDISLIMWCHEYDLSLSFTSSQIFLILRALHLSSLLWSPLPLSLPPSTFAVFLILLRQIARVVPLNLRVQGVSVLQAGISQDHLPEVEVLASCEISVCLT